MQLTQVITRSSLAAIALLNLSLATSAFAEPIVVTRGPNGAAHVVKTDNVPVDANVLPNNKIGAIAQAKQTGIGGAELSVTSRLIQRGPNGAFFPSK